jgi:cytochrome c oxidase subunit 1
MGQRLRGFTNGRFEWLAKAPWGDPGFSGMMLSLVIFGFMGGITGVTIGTEQINIIAHNTLKVPGHFHVTVVGGTALAFMAVTYYVLPLIFRKKVAFWGLAKLQPWLFGIGIALMGSAMTFLGSFGVPRRHWDITARGAPFSLDFPPATNLYFALMAIGGLLAVTGAFAYIAIAVVSVFFGAPVTEADLKPGVPGIPQGVGKLPPQTHTIDPAFERAGAPGTVVLVGVFLAAFALYYFVNWQALSFVWKVG